LWSLFHHIHLLKCLKDCQWKLKRTLIWIATDFNNELLFDLFASELIELFPNKKSFFEHKQEITDFIAQSLNPDLQVLYKMKFPRKITPQDVKQRQDKKNLQGRIYRLYLKLPNKLYGSDLTSFFFVVPNDEVEDAPASSASPPKQQNRSIDIDSEDEDEDISIVRPAKQQKTFSIVPASPPPSDPWCILCMSPLLKEAMFHLQA
jgi:hypothetical protein